jgi:hypothetical protein
MIQLSAKVNRNTTVCPKIRYICSPFSGGLIALLGTINTLFASGELAQLARALAWHARGRRFDSDILHKTGPRSGFLFTRQVFVIHPAMDNKIV